MVASLVVSDENILRRALYAWFAGLGIVMLLGLSGIFIFFANPESAPAEYLLSHLGAVPAGPYPRVQASLYGASHLANFLTVSVALIFIGWARRWISGALAMVAVFIAGAIALATVSSALGGLLVVIGVWIWLSSPERKAGLLALCLSGAAALLLAGVSFVALQHYPDAPFSLSLSGFEFQPSPRLLVWIEALQTIVANPFTGVGLGLPVAEVAFTNSDGSRSLLTDAHNVFLSIGGQAGLAATVSFAGILAALMNSLFRLRESKPHISAGLFLVIVVGVLYQGIFASYEDSRHLWLVFGFVIGITRKQNRR